MAGRAGDEGAQRRSSTCSVPLKSNFRNPRLICPLLLFVLSLALTSARWSQNQQPDQAAFSARQSQAQWEDAETVERAQVAAELTFGQRPFRHDERRLAVAETGRAPAESVCVRGLRSQSEASAASPAESSPAVDQRNVSGRSNSPALNIQSRDSIWTCLRISRVSVSPGTGSHSTSVPRGRRIWRR